MIIYRKIQSLIFIVIIFFSLIRILYSHESIKSYDVDVRIWAEKDQFFIYEPVRIFIRMENNSEEGPKIIGIDLPHHFIVTDSKGTQYRPNIFLDLINVPPMKKGEIFERTFNLASLYERRNHDPVTTRNSLPSELYTLYFSWKESRYHKPIESNKIEITIIKPVGEELSALNLLIKGIEKRNNREFGDEYFDELVDKYPKSVYATRALFLKMSSRLYKKEMIHLTRNMETGKRFLDNYPDSRYRGTAFGAIRNYYKKNNDLNGFTRYLQELNKKTKSALIKETTDNILKTIEQTKTWDDIIQKPAIDTKKEEEIPPPNPPKRKNLKDI